jgi:hypothetical protein
LPMKLIYLQPGCDQLPVCAVPDNDACATVACGCDGQLAASGCGFTYVPYRHGGECTDADVPVDVGPVDASTPP